MTKYILKYGQAFLIGYAVGLVMGILILDYLIRHK